MEKRIIICPNCRSRLTVEDQPGLENKNLECPNCKFKAKVSVFMTGAASTGGHGADTESTRLPFDMPVRSVPGQFRIVQTNELIPLHLGFQTIGRRVREPRADILIGNSNYNDTSMSRRHVSIEVVKMPNGIQHRLHEIGSTNIIQVNGQDIPRNGIIALRIGDRMTLGETDLILENADEEATRVAP